MRRSIPLLCKAGRAPGDKARRFLGGGPTPWGLLFLSAFVRLRESGFTIGGTDERAWRNDLTDGQVVAAGSAGRDTGRTVIWKPRYMTATPAARLTEKRGTTSKPAPTPD